MAITYNYIDIAKRNPDNILSLAYGSGVLELLLADDISFSTGNTWQAPLEGSIINSLGGITTAINIGKQALNSSLELKSMRETILYYTGSDSLDFRFNCMLIANRSTDNLNTLLKPLLDLTNPDFDASSSFNVTLKAPLNYAPSPDSAEGKIAIKIGRVFRTTRVYVLKSSTVTLSKARLPNGLPLYCSVQLDLKPFRLLSKTEVYSFFM